MNPPPSLVEEKITAPASTPSRRLFSRQVSDPLSKLELKPIAPPRKSAWTLFREVLDHGGPGFLQFAITNVCNAKCDFCGFAVDRFDPKQRKSVTLSEARDVIDIALRNHIGYLLFVGGEPLVHPHLMDMIRYAAESGISPMICSNGSLFTPEKIDRLCDSGLSSVILSIDSHEVAVHEKNRGLPDVCQKIKTANAHFKRRGIQVTASVTVSKLIEDYFKLPDFLKSLGFENVTFSYPLQTLGSSYLSFSDSKLVSYTNEELINVFDQLKELKKDFHVFNPRASMNDMQRHLRGEKERFGCLGGLKYFYLDWKLDLYRCHYWEKPMCNIYEFDSSKLIRDGCTRCMIDCYRDPSVLQSLAININDAAKSVKKGRFIQAAKSILHSNNVVSIRSVIENADWIRRV
jgi:MoaA/NifB/PqqE/SkfB family radical SAM enzyme